MLPCICKFERYYVKPGLSRESTGLTLSSNSTDSAGVSAIILITTVVNLIKCHLICMYVSMAHVLAALPTYCELSITTTVNKYLWCFKYILMGNLLYT